MKPHHLPDPFLLRLFLTFTLLSLSGCSSVYTTFHRFPPDDYYSGTKQNIDIISAKNSCYGQGCAVTIFEVPAWIDLAPSFVADTLFLPYVAIGKQIGKQTATHKGDPAPPTGEHLRTRQMQEIQRKETHFCRHWLASTIAKRTPCNLLEMTDQHLQIDQKITEEEKGEMQHLLNFWRGQRDLIRAAGKIRAVGEVYPNEEIFSETVQFEELCFLAQENELDLVNGKTTWMEFNRRRIELHDKEAAEKALFLFNHRKHR